MTKLTKRLHANGVYVCKTVLKFLLKSDHRYKWSYQFLYIVHICLCAVEISDSAI
jgi:hypothetical protein